MKENIYIFTNSILRKKENTLAIETLQGFNRKDECDITDIECDTLITPADESRGTKAKYIPVDNINSVFTIGSVKFNTHFFSLMSKNGIPVHILNYYGNYTGSFLPKGDISSGNILISQVEHYNNDAKRLYIAKQFVESASINAINNLKYYLFRKADLKDEIESLKSVTSQIQNVNSIGELMGIEGNIKSRYFRCWQKIFKVETGFTKRVRKPPDNIINSLISFGNVVFYNICLNEIFRSGLSPAIGYLHSPADNRTPLAFDISETFKPIIIDKVIFRLVNLDMLSEDDFFINDEKVFLKDKIKKVFINEIEQRLKTTIYHKNYKRNISYKSLIRLDCYALIKHLTEDKEFNPFISEV